MSEGVPPAPAPAPRPARPLAPAPAPAPAPSAGTVQPYAADRSFTPTLHQSAAPPAMQPAGGGFETVAAFMEEQQGKLVALLREERGAFEAKLSEANLAQQVTTLQLRIQALHASELLTDEERDCLEDAIVDGELSAEPGTTVAQMVAVSGRVATDAAFARQLRREFV